MKERIKKLKLYFSEFNEYEKFLAITLFLNFDKYEFIDNFNYNYPIILIRNIEDDTIYEFKNFLRTTIIK